MSPLKFVKAVAETYFVEKDKAWRNSKRCWDVLFISFFALYLFQIYAAYMDWRSVVVWQSIANEVLINPDEFWQTKLSAMYLQGIVLFGVFIKFYPRNFVENGLSDLANSANLLPSPHFSNITNGQ